MAPIDMQKRTQLEDLAHAKDGVTGLRGFAQRLGRAADGPRGRRARRLLARLLPRYPALAPAPRGRWARLALGLVVLCMVAFVAFFSAYLFALHDAYMTHAEDLGIMDQALWNTLHGAPLHQTICNSVSDVNCLGDVSRLAIHFEPIMFPLALLYLVAPSPKTLQLVQALIVALGALPAYWIASRRLRSPLAGVVVAVIYLLFPALDAAVTYDFHAVTLSATFLLFAFYFMLTRNNVGLLIACVLTLATKEEMAVVVLVLGLSIALLQRRGRVGWGVVALSLAWLGLELAIMSAVSPLGHSPTAGRYAQLGSSPSHIALYLLTHPMQVVQRYVLEPAHANYLRGLLSPVAYLPLLSPFALLIATPELAINLLSSYPAMYSGLYHYNADIVPVMIFAAIEGTAALSRGVARGVVVVRRARHTRANALDAGQTRMAARVRGVRRGTVLALLLAMAIFSAHEQTQHGATPLTKGFTWPQTSAHAQLAEQFIKMIPANASVSAQSDLVPHLSQRRYVYLYPYQGTTADYVLLDVTGNTYPLDQTDQGYTKSVRQLLSLKSYHILAADDGYLLLQRGAGSTTLPASFYSFTQAAPGAIPHATGVRFGAAIDLVGYDVSPAPTLYLNHPYITVTTYWRVERPLQATTFPELVMTRTDGSEYVNSTMPAVQWYPMARWQPGQTIVVRSEPLPLSSAELGTLRIGMRVQQAPVSGGPATPLPATSLPTSAGQGSTITLLRDGAVAVFADEQVAS